MALKITPDIERAPWDDVDVDALPDARLEAVGGLANATAAGKPAVMVRMEVKREDGTEETVIAQTTLALFLTAADGLKACHGDPR